MRKAYQYLMRNDELRTFLAFIFILNVTLVWSEAPKLYTNEFAVRLEGGDAAAHSLAEENNLINRGQIGGLKGFYLFEVPRISKRSLDYSHEHHHTLKADKRVLWVEQQHARRRVKRDTALPLNHIPDPLYPQQWYLMKGAKGGFDMNVQPAWEAGFTGKGVVVTILDDGIQTNHPDLVQNYDPRASYDINGRDSDPMPTDDNKNKHGTRCAGEVAATAFNDFCGIGVAFNASIGGVRMLDGTVTDEVEARALSLNRDHIHIYSASWGPEDDGKTVDGPGRLAKQAFIEGIQQGRNGKGSIFVWASGNGGRYKDNCNCDGYTNSIYTLSISSATQEGLKPWYLEECSSTLATTYSSGTFGHDRSVVTVDMDTSYFRQLSQNLTPDPSRLCTKSHTGTSASAPIAAGLCALALEANPDLTWRDMQYIVLMTSRPQPLLHVEGWATNGVGRPVSHKFGYGMMDAAAMVKLAQSWTTVPPQLTCRTPASTTPQTIPTQGRLEVTLSTDGCKGQPIEINYLEHVQAIVTLDFFPRGNLHIILVSPSGTRSSLLFPRRFDREEQRLDNWPFLSVHYWGESPKGTWKLIIANEGPSRALQDGTLYQWSLVFYGTKNNPVNLHSINHTNHHDIREAPLVGHANPCAAEKKFSLNDVCLEECSEGYYPDPLRWECKPCHSLCLTCSGPSENECLACSSDFLFKDTCVKNCPAGYYSDGTLLECLPCHSFCATCEHNPHICRTCKPGFVYSRSGCTLRCPPHHYVDQKDRSCKACKSPCAECYLKADHCTKCFAPRVLHENTCLEACPSGFYPQNNTCVKCKEGCKECTDYFSCTSCQDGLSLNYGSCSLSCSLDDGSCSCSVPHCQHCLDSDHCSSCDPSSWVATPDGACRESCPKGYFKSPPSGDRRYSSCVPCSPPCLACSAPDQCQLCSEGLVVSRNACLPFCPVKWYKDQNGTCQPCHESCEECNGSKPEDCLLCRSDLHMMVGKGCISLCPEGTFADSMRKCQPCHHHCLTCQGPAPTSCTSCQLGTTLFKGSCLPCPSNEYYDTSTQSCMACDKSCGSCFGPGSQECLSCEDPLKYDPKAHVCLPCCANGGSSLHGICCHCQGNSSECTQSVPLAGTFTYIVVGACTLSVIAFFLLFAVLQATSQGWCRNWSVRKYRLVPATAKFDPSAERVSLTHELAAEEEDDDDSQPRA